MKTRTRFGLLILGIFAAFYVHSASPRDEVGYHKAKHEIDNKASPDVVQIYSNYIEEKTIEIENTQFGALLRPAMEEITVSPISMEQYAESKTRPTRRSPTIADKWRVDRSREYWCSSSHV